MKFVLPTLLFCVSASSASFHVAISGNDTSGTGQSEKPWRTIQRALDRVAPGDTIIVSPGDYREYLQTRTHGKEDQRIVLRADPPNRKNQPVIVRSLRLSHAAYTVEGLTFTGASDSHKPWGISWGANIRIEPGANQAVITNNTIRDTPYAIASDFRFNADDNSVSSPSSDFVGAGFEPGSQVYLGSCSSIPYTNHNTRWIVRNLTPTTLWLTNNVGGRFLPDPGTGYWAAVHAGGTSGGYPAIAFIPAGGIGAANCEIVNNTITNVFGSAIDLYGSGHLVQSNYCTRLNSYYAIRMLGSNLRVRGNTWINLANILWYTADELQTIPHPVGTGWYDYQVGVIHSVPQPGAVVTNNVFEFNWIQNVENQLGNTAWGDIARDITFRNNVFVGVGAQSNGGRDGISWLNNTFYRCSYDASRSLVIATGGRNKDQVVTGITISSNLFIACGDRSRRSLEGFYSVSDFSADVVTRRNFVAGPEITGWEGRALFTEPDGFNGSNPIFLDEFNPLGPDGLPFTSDDGLRPLPNSPAASFGIGALPPMSSFGASPLAHFSIREPLGWHEPIGLDIDPTWSTKTPWERKTPIRPYTTVDALPKPPCTVVFDAATSFAGFQGQIVEYRWDFGDGSAAVVDSPVVQHTFQVPGTFWVSLSVRNALGLSHSTRRPYRVPGPDVNERPSRPAGFRVVIR